MADIQATARCFWELKKRGVINLSEKYIVPNVKFTLDENREVDEENIEIGGQIWTSLKNEKRINH